MRMALVPLTLIAVTHVTPARAQTEVPEPASAEAPDNPPAPAPPLATRTLWYGWQTMLTDGGAVALWLLADAAHEAHFTHGSAYEQAATAAVVLGFGAYALGGPAVHAVRGAWGRAGGSLALRLGLPLVAGALGLGLSKSACGDSESCPAGYALVGLMLGGVAASAIDAAALAYERVPASTRGLLGFSLLPTPGGGGAVSLVGRF